MSYELRIMYYSGINEIRWFVDYVLACESCRYLQRNNVGVLAAYVYCDDELLTGFNRNL